MAVRSYNIAIIPTPGIAEKAAEMSRLLQPYGSLFVLDEKRYFSHLSLYHVEFPEEAVPQVISALQSAVPRIASFPLVPESYRTIIGVWIDMGYRRDPHVMALHQAVIDATKDYRATEDYEAQVGWVGLPKIKQDNLQNVGWAEANELFIPHLTFGKLAEPNEEVAKTLPQEDFGFTVTKVGLYERGEYGTCTKLLAEFNLGG